MKKYNLPKPYSKKFIIHTQLKIWSVSNLEIAVGDRPDGRSTFIINGDKAPTPGEIKMYTSQFCGGYFRCGFWQPHELAFLLCFFLFCVGHVVFHSPTTSTELVCIWGLLGNKQRHAYCIQSEIYKMFGVLLFASTMEESIENENVAII